MFINQLNMRKWGFGGWMGVNDVVCGIDEGFLIELKKELR